MVVKKISQINSYIESLNTQEKKDGYASVLHHVFIDIRSGLYNADTITFISNVLHEMPPFISRDLKGFNDEYFWLEVLNSESVAERLYNYFKIGVEFERTKRELLSKVEG